MTLVRSGCSGKRMKIYHKITSVISKIAEGMVTGIVAALVILIVTELCRRDFFNTSWLPTTEVCGILFLWMAFIGLIPLVHNSGLMRLDFLISRLKGAFSEFIWYMTIAIIGAFGIAMIFAFVTQYPFVSTRTYATMPSLTYTIQYVPLVISGAYMAADSVDKIIGRIAQRGGKKA